MALDGFDIRTSVNSEYDADDMATGHADGYGSYALVGEMHHPFGFRARPADPDADGRGCQTFTAYEGGRVHQWLSYDPRAIEKLPPIKKGESQQYSIAGNFIRCHLDGTVSIYTTDAGGHPDGQSVYSQTAPDGFTRNAPWGTEKFDAGGWRITTHTGARIGLGGVGGLPGPLSSLGTYFSVRASIVTVECSGATFGSGATALAKVSGIDAFIDVLIAALNLITAGSGTTGGAPAATALTTAKPLLIEAMKSIVAGA